MTPLQWFYFSIALAILCFVGMMDLRWNRRKRREVNAGLEKMSCPSCGGPFARWTGEKSSNHYVFAEGALIQDVLSVTCTHCKNAFDVFLQMDGTLEMQPSAPH